MSSTAQTPDFGKIGKMAGIILAILYHCENKLDTQYKRRPFILGLRYAFDCLRSHEVDVLDMGFAPDCKISLVADSCVSLLIELGILEGDVNTFVLRNPKNLKDYLKRIYARTATKEALEEAGMNFGAIYMVNCGEEIQKTTV